MLIMRLCQLQPALLPHLNVARSRAVQPGPCNGFSPPSRCSLVEKIGVLKCRGACMLRVQQALPQHRRLLARPQNSMVKVEAWRPGDGALWTPPTVADTKRKFYEAFRKPVPGIYNNIIQELLVQQHLMRWNKKYTYDEVRGGLFWPCAWAPSGRALA